jgi:hypothetical protein
MNYIIIYTFFFIRVILRKGAYSKFISLREFFYFWKKQISPIFPVWNLHHLANQKFCLKSAPLIDDADCFYFVIYDSIF